MIVLFCSLNPNDKETNKQNPHIFIFLEIINQHAKIIHFSKGNSSEILFFGFFLLLFFVVVVVKTL